MPADSGAVEAVAPGRIRLPAGIDLVTAFAGLAAHGDDGLVRLDGDRLYTIERIERVVNDTLWRKHAMCKRGIKTDTGGLSANEAILFHGTRATKPEVIADDGLDFRFSQAGMWGRAAYAAVNATYSNNYAYTGAGDGTKQMFAVSAALGNAARARRVSARAAPTAASSVSSSLALAWLGGLGSGPVVSGQG